MFGVLRVLQRITTWSSNYQGVELFLDRRRGDEINATGFIPFLLALRGLSPPPVKNPHVFVFYYYQNCAVFLPESSKHLFWCIFWLSKEPARPVFFYFKNGFLLRNVSVFSNRICFQIFFVCVLVCQAPSKLENMCDHRAVRFKSIICLCLCRIFSYLLQWAPYLAASSWLFTGWRTGLGSCFRFIRSTKPRGGLLMVSISA